MSFAEDQGALTEKRESLLRLLASMEDVTVAFSGGVDSAVVAQAAQLALGPRAVAVTGCSPSLARGELESARQLAGQIGIRHEVIETEEFGNDSYTRNAPDRCYHCKDELYGRMEMLIGRVSQGILVNGANTDDLEDYRPGMRAAGEHQVRSPLAECGICKQEVRNLALHWDLPVWDKPATPCLASRVAYGEEVTPDRLAMIDRAEILLRGHGFGTVRVRYHNGDLARLEIPLDDFPRLLQSDFYRQLSHEMRQIGFKFVTLDLEGFRSGSLNALVPVELTLPTGSDASE
ncbi:MAG: ATP-dependent sacrificial sulfur transferase LarE [Planctomycetota bacterium]|nr:ATP-dependent sacrificial sulfur transferase LarE [Planctomycetota bacterium]